MRQGHDMTDSIPVPDDEAPAHDDDLDPEGAIDELDTDPETPAHPEGDPVVLEELDEPVE
jgi:hypothetical protein